ncbi:MAG: TrmH family RNA methyltransferase [Flavobacteriales bacterium]
MSGSTQLKRVRALHRRKEREEQGLFLVQGRKLVGELLKSSMVVLEIYGTEDAAREMGLEGGTQLGPGAAKTAVSILPAHDLDRMGTLQSGNEVLAVVRMPTATELRMPGEGMFNLALDGVSDPGNLGTLLRIADWFGATQVWCAGGVDPYNPKTVQSSMGSLFRLVPCAVEDLSGALAKAHAEQVSVYKAESSGESVFDSRMKKPCILVMGSESHGLSEGVRAAPGTSIAIPGHGGAESLNVAAAAAALCMELKRP